MKVILYMAMSIDGKIAGIDDDVSWVEDSDVERMDKLMKECGVMLMGSNTYKSFSDDLPSEDALQVVATHNKDLLNKELNNVKFTDKSPDSLLLDLEEEGFKKVLLAGGGELNTSFLKMDLIDEIRLIIKPIVLGTGKSIFNDMDIPKTFKLETNKQLEYGDIELSFIK